MMGGLQHPAPLYDCLSSALLDTLLLYMPDVHMRSIEMVLLTITL